MKMRTVTVGGQNAGNEEEIEMEWEEEDNGQR